MAVYLLVPLEKIKDSINNSVIGKINSSDRYQLQNERGWLIKYSGTSVELSNFLNITSEKENHLDSVGSAIIVPVSFFYGRGNRMMWEWIKIKMEEK